MSIFSRTCHDCCILTELQLSLVDTLVVDHVRERSNALIMTEDRMYLVWSDSPSASEESGLTKSDLARFAHLRNNRQAVCAERATSSHQPVVSLLQTQWGEFVSFCDATSTSSRGHGSHANESKCHGSVQQLEEYFAARTSHHAIRHTGILTEELLLLCVPSMTSILEQRCEDAAVAYDDATSRIANLASEEPWRSGFAKIKERLGAHVEYCEHIELDERINSVEKGAALEKLLELREDKAALVDALKEMQLQLLPTLDPHRNRLELMFRRIVAHRACRAQGRSVVQHLPSFECTLLSDKSNDCWRPVRAALLFSGWELATRAAHDAFRERLQAAHGAQRPEVEDEVEVIQGILTTAMKTTPVQQEDFFRLASILLKW